MRTFTQKLAFLLVALLCYVGVQAQETITLTGNISQTLTPGQSYLFYDSGGPTGNYGSGQSYTAVLTNDGGSITINFSALATESSSGCSNWDYMLIYDDETLIGRAQTGCASATITTGQDYVAESGTLKIEWHSDDSSVAAGWEATITAAGGEVTCNTVETVEVTDVAVRQATINWTGGDGSYAIEYKTASANRWESVTGLTGNSYVLSNLEPNTSYSVKVYNVCGAESVSYAKSASFTTSCEVVSTFPWSEDFNGRNTGKIAIPCWGNAHIAGSRSDVFTIADGTGGNSTKVGRLPDMAAGNLTLLSLPEMNLPVSARGYEFDIDVYRNFYSTIKPNEGLRVYLSASTQLEDTVLLAFIPRERTLSNEEHGVNAEEENGWYSYEFTLPIESGSCRIFILGVSEYGSATYFDNIKVKERPTCFKPTDLHEVEGHATKSSIQLDWTANTEETAWKLQYKKASESEWNTADADSKPYTLSGLDAFTKYNVQVAADCGGGDISEYGKAISVKTAADVPFAEGFNTYSLSADWKRYAGVLEDVMNGAELEPVSAGWNTGNKTNNVFPDSTYHLYLNIAGETTNHWIVSPMIDMETGYQLSFDLALTAKAGANPTAATAGQQMDDKFAVIIKDDEGWHILRTWDNESTQDYDEINATANGQVIKMDLSEYAGKTIQIAFYGESTVAGGNNNLHISNFRIALPPACEPATQLNITGIGGTFATAVWDNIEGAVWQYCLQANPAADFVPTDFVTMDAGVYTITLETLSENTEYGFFLRRKCGEAEFSDIISRSFKTIQTPVILDREHSFSDDFESGNKWVLLNGGQTNQWAHGTAVSNGGSRALYISNDAGVSNAMTYDYSWNTSYVYAYKTFNIAEEGVYTFSYDWRNKGGYSYYLRVYLAPLTAEPTAGSSAPSSGWTKMHSASSLYGQSDWQHESFEYRIEETGTYKVILYWYNYYSDYGSSIYNPPAAVDNFAISRLACPKPKGLALAELGADTAKFEWESASDGSFEYAYARLADDMPEEFTPVAENNSVVLSGLTSLTAYKFYLRKACSETEKSDVVSLNFTTKQLPVEVGNAFSDDFEGENGWVFTNSTNHGWVVGTAAHNGENSTKAMYVSKDNGETNSYNTSGTNIVYASKLFHFADGDYIFRFDWLGDGEGSSTSDLDYLRVAIAPASVNLVAGSVPSGFSNTRLPSGWIALDGGSALNNQTEWQNVISNEINITEGDYIVLFGWKNNYSGGDNPAGAIDNFSITKVLCQKPIDLQVVADSTTTTSVVLTWTPKGTESDWLVRYRKVGAEAWNTPIAVAHVDGNAADSLKIVVEPSSAYEAQVAALCDPSDPESASEYSASITFASGCDVISSLSENFDAVASGTGNALPLCWSYINKSSSSYYDYYPRVYNSSSYANSGSNSLKFYSYYSSTTDYDPRDQYAILPEFTGVSDKRIKLNARANSTGSSYDATFIVGVMTDPADAATFVAIDTLNPDNTDYEPFVVMFNTYGGEGKFIAIKMQAANSAKSTHGLYIDDIVVEDIPSCLEVTGPIAVSGVTNDAASFSWPAEEDAAWKYAIALASAEEPADDEFISIDTNFVAIESGLTDNADHIFYLRRDCGSSMSPSLTAAFKTTQVPVTAPFADDFEAGNTWALINGSLTNAWVHGDAAYAGESGHALYISNDGGATNAYTTDDAAAMVYATKLINIAEAGSYTFSYDWKANGESSYDFLRVALVPSSVALSAATSRPAGLSSSDVPAGWIALDGGSKLNLDTAWQHVSLEMPIDSVGLYNVVLAWRNDGSGGSQTPAAVDNFSITKVDCAKPAGLKVSEGEDAVTVTSAQVEWASGNAGAWVLQYRKNSDKNWIQIENEIAENLYVLSGLQAASTYYVRVAAVCGENLISDFSDSIAVTTDCAEITAFPYRENFDAITGYSYSHVLPLCWSFINTCTYDYDYDFTIYPTVNTDHELYFRSEYEIYDYDYGQYYPADPQDQYAILPEMSGINNLRIKLNARATSTGSSYDATFIVGVMTDPEDASTFVEVASKTPASTSYESYTIPFSGYTGAGKYIAIKMTAATLTKDHAVVIDDIAVDEIPSCIEPAGVIEVSNITEHGASFAWTNEEDAAWKYAVVLASAEEPADDEFISIDTNSVAIESGLTDNTDYIFYLRRDCGSSMSPSVLAPFHTIQTPASVPFADNFEESNNWFFVNTANGWVIGSAAQNIEGSTKAMYISKDGAANEYSVTSASVSYAVKRFSIPAGGYVFSYDWKANGESNCDYLRVALVPDSIALPTSFSYTSSLPKGWIALDGGSILNLSADWTTYTSAEIHVDEGTYKMVFVWRNDGSVGSQAPAAIDNFAITKVLCSQPVAVTISDLTASSAAIGWTNGAEGQDAWQIAIDTLPTNRPDTLPSINDVTENPYVLSGLDPETNYYVYVRANCGDEQFSNWSARGTFRTAKSCQTPDDLAAADIDASSALISWNTYGQSGFNLRYIHGTDTVLVSNVESPYELTGLDANTLYKVQVQVPCEPDQWSASLNFRTDCEIWSIATDGNYVEGFESYAGTAYDVYNNQLSCWTMGGNATYLPHVANSGSYGYYPHSGTKALSFYGSANSVSYAVLPQFAEDLNGLQISFWARVENASYGTMSLGYVTADSVFHQLTTVPCTTTTTKYEYILDTVPAVAGRLAFCWVYTGTSYYTAGIDDIEVEFIPTCLAPKAVAASDIFAHSAKISWTNGAEGQDAWQIAIDTLPTNRPDTLLNIIAVTENPYVLNGLDPETRYYIYVRANCGAGDFSKFSDGINFKTTIACPAPSALKATLTPGNGSIATLSWSAGAEENAWILEYSLNADLSDSSEVLAYDTFVNLTALTAEQTYYARVKADCGELDGESLYSAIISFKPTNKYEILINDGATTNGVVPVEGNWADHYSLGQFIVPAEQLEDLVWDSIQSLTFFASTVSHDFGEAQFKAYVAELEESSFASATLYDWSDLHQVMADASLSVADGKMVVTFDEPYQYEGGNLLIGIEQTVPGSFKDFSWYGVTANDASVGGHKNKTSLQLSVSQRNFLPKMLIEYAPGVEPACKKPAGLVVSDIAAFSATVAWNEIEGANWEYAVRPASEPAPVSFENSTNNHSVVLDQLSENTEYVFYLRQACGEDGNSAVVSIAFTTDIRKAELPFYEDFENPNSGWKLLNGNQPNAWMIGGGAAKDDAQALYISNNGTDNTYTKDVQSSTFAYILLDFAEAGDYVVEYDWRAYGDYSEEDALALDYMRVALIPNAVAFAAGDADIPAAAIALDENDGLYFQNEWQHLSKEVNVPAGLYKLAVAWFNDNDADFGEDYPGAIDNISIREKGAPTSISNTGFGTDGKAIKFIRDEKVFILVNGVIYDATGRKVEVVK